MAQFHSDKIKLFASRVSLNCVRYASSGRKSQIIAGTQTMRFEKLGRFFAGTAFLTTLYLANEGYKRTVAKRRLCRPLEKNPNMKANLNLVVYEKCVVTQDSVVSGLLQKIADFEVQNEDVFVASFPKSGTTWLQQVVYLLCNPNDNQSEEVMEDKFPYLEHIYPGLGEIQKRFGQKRFIKTHLPFHLLPKQITEKQKQAKVIYIYRDPKDVIVSYYYFARMLTYVAYIGSLNDFAWDLMFDRLPYSPYFSHLDGYLSAKSDHILVVRYEDMKSDPLKVIETIAKFLNVPTTKESLDKIHSETTFEAMKSNPSTNYQHWNTYGLRNPNEAEFMRKGIVGDHKNHFSPDLHKDVDFWIETSLDKHPHLSHLKELFVKGQ